MRSFHTLTGKILFTALLIISLSNSVKAQPTTLVPGDIAFSGYIGRGPLSSTDAFSFVLLKAVNAGTIIKFTDYGWAGSSFNSAGASETEATLVTLALPAGTEIKIENTSATIVGGGTAGALSFTVGTAPDGTSFFSTNFSLNGQNGDQVLIYQNDITAPSFIAGLHWNVVAGMTTDAGWDVSVAAGPSSSLKPAALTAGTSSLWMFSTSDGVDPEKGNGRFLCGPDVSTVALARPALYNRANWGLNDNEPGPPTPTPIGFSLPTGCNYLGVLSSPPVITVPPSNVSICDGSNTSFSVTATGASSHQWQVDIDGAGAGGFANVANGGVYSNVTTATLNITGATLSMNGYIYRDVATNGAGSTTSASATLTVIAIPANPTLFAKTPAAASVADGTNVSATFSAGSGGTGCIDEYRYTIDGGATYLPYTPGDNISTTGLSTGSGFVFIEGRRATCSSLCQNDFAALASWLVTPLPATGPTPLVKGDIAFTGYASSYFAVADDNFSFVLLKNIGPNTAISFTDNGWTGTALQSESGEGTVLWTSNASYRAGTEIKINGLTATLTGGGSAGTVTGTALNLNTTGDQILAYTGTAASPTFITGIHMNLYSIPINGDAVTTNASVWDGAGTANLQSNCRKPATLTTGVDCIWIGTEADPSSEFDNSRYGNCALPATFGSIALLRAALNDKDNWTSDNSQPPLFGLPTGCPYLGIGATPPTINTNPGNLTVCENASAAFSITATGALTYQWQVDADGAGPGGFANVTNGGVYSGATAPTLNISAAALSMNGYVYRAAAINGAGSVTSTPATLTVNALPIAPTLLAKIPASNTVGDGTNVSATFSGGSGGTGCSNDYRYTINGGNSYLAYTPGDPISTTGVAAGSGFVFIEGRRANCSAGCQGPYKVLAAWRVTPIPVTASLLNPGDIAFSAYAGTSTNDDFSFVLLRNIGPGTVIIFTDNGYQSGALTSGEGTVTWTAPAGGLPGGTEITISGLTATRSGGGAAGTATGTPLGLITAGDQIIAYRTTGGLTFISAIHMNVYSIPNDAFNTTAAAWDGASGTGTTASALPPGLTTGVNAIWIGVEADFFSEHDNAKFGNCASPAMPGSLVALRAALNNKANWITDDLIPPSFTQPTGCNYLNALCPVITVTNPGVTTGMNGVPFSQTFTQTGAVGGATFTINSGTLPTGLTLSSAGVLSGTPTQTGPFSITVQVIDGSGCTGSGATYNLVIAAPAPIMSSSLRDALQVDNNSNLVVNPGDQLRYTTVIRNTGNVDATALQFNLGPSTHSTLNPGSTSTSALARDDAFTALFQTVLTAGNVLTNDFGLNAGVPTLSVVSFGTSASLGTTTAAGSAGTTNAGGTLTVNANGTFSYQPPAAFTGTDQFMYIATTGVAGLPNNDAVVVITVSPDIIFSTTPVNPACNGASTGSITFSGVSGGSGPAYTYSVTGPGGTFQASTSFTGLVAGTYNPAVKDGAGNIKTAAAITLTNPPLISFTTTNVNPTCGGSNGSITFNASGGTGTLNYSVTGAAGTYQSSNVFNSLAAATYNLAVRDANNCIVTGTATLSGPPPVTFTFTKTDVTCFGAANGTITFNAPSGGTSPYTYSITGTGGTFQVSNSFTGLVPNTYTLVVKDANLCNSATQSTTVTQPAQIVVSGTVPQLTYNTAMTPVTFTKTGGVGSPANPWSATGLPTNLTLNTATGQLSGTPNVTGSFPVVITYTDATSCTGTLSFNIDVAPNIVAETYTDVGNTQLRGGVAAPATPHVAVAGVESNDASNAAITYALISGPTQGTITLNTDGTFLYTPALNNTTTATFVYSGTSNGVSKNATATINFNGKVWYVQGGAAAGDGRSNTPLNTLPNGNLGAGGDFIYVLKEATGTTPGSITLQASQQLIGAGATLNVPTVSPVLTIAGVAGNTPVLTNTITLANSVTVNGIDMSTTTNTAVTNAGNTVTGVNFTARNVTTSTGTGLNVSGTGNNVTMTLTSLTTGAPANSVTLTNTAGTVTINGGLLQGGGGSGILFNVIGGTVNTTCSATLSQNSNSPTVSVSGGHTGTLGFSGNISIQNGTGLQFDNADGTYNFNGTTNTLNGGDAGIDIVNGSSGTFSFSNATITTPNSGPGFNLLNSDANVTYNGTLIQSIGFAISINNHDAGTITFGGGSITSNGGAGITITECNGGTITINSPVTLLTGVATALNLTNNNGATINTTAGLNITTTSGTGFNATGGGTINVTGSGNTISKSGNGNALNITGTNAGGSGINFASINVTGGTGTAVNISSSTGTKSLGDVDVARSGGGTGIFASNAGTLNTTSGTINSGNQVAIDIDNTALGMILQRIDVNGGANGIDLNTTTGSFAVSGNGAANSGGTIQNQSADGVHLVSATGISLTDMVISTSGGSWIDASTVTGLTLIRMNADLSTDHGILGSSLTNLSIQGGVFNRGAAGNGLANFDGVHITNLLGNSSVTGATFTRSNTRQFYVLNNAATNFAGTPDILTVSNNQWNTHTGPFSGDHLSVSADNGGNFRLIVNNTGGANVFKTGGIGVQATGAGTGKMDAQISGIISGGTIASGEANTAGVAVAGTASSSVTFNVSNNTTLGTGSVGMTLNDFTSGTFSGTLSNNNITHIAGAGTDALQIVSHGDQPGSDGTATITVSNNIIIGNFQRGIRSQAAFGDGTLNLTISGNTVHGTEPTATALRAIEVEVGGSGGGTTNILQLNLLNNNAWMDNGNAGYRLFHRAGYTFSLKDLTGSGTDPVNITNWIDNVKSNNSNGGAATTLITGAANNFTSF